jgi:hypothetical protein
MLRIKNFMSDDIVRPHGVAKAEGTVAESVPLIVDPSATLHGGTGGEFNIIRAVQEHVPARIDAINAELGRIQQRERELNTEHETLMRLLAAVSQPNF